MFTSSNSQNKTLEISLDLLIEEKTYIQIPDTSKAVSYETLTSEDMLTIFENLENKTFYTN